jgi:2-oxo-4-hydroxy-4-carboxy--5-ureidoimidazoline (OHCU) decarboxylase
MTKSTPCVFCGQDAKERDWPAEEAAICDRCVARHTELIEAFGAINWAEFKHKIDRAERNRRLVALRGHPRAAGLTFEQRDVLARVALERCVKALDEMNKLGATWQ